MIYRRFPPHPSIWLPCKKRHSRFAAASGRWCNSMRENSLVVFDKQTTFFLLHQLQLSAGSQFFSFCEARANRCRLFLPILIFPRSCRDCVIFPPFVFVPLQCPPRGAPPPRLPCNRKRNRYGSILANEPTRVKLTPAHGAAPTVPVRTLDP